MVDQKAFSMGALMRDLAEDGEMQIAAATVAKCTNMCLISLKESTLLPTEESCMMNCYNKAWEFNANYNEKLAYATRQINSYN